MVKTLCRDAACPVFDRVTPSDRGGLRRGKPRLYEEARYPVVKEQIPLTLALDASKLEAT